MSLRSLYASAGTAASTALTVSPVADVT